MRMLFIATKCKARFVALTVQKRFHFNPTTIPRVLVCGTRRSCIPRAESLSNPESIIHEENKKRREQIEKAKNVAFSLVMKRTVSQQQLRMKLKEKGIVDEDVIQRTLDRMVELNLQSDLDYATSFAITKWKRSKWSFKKIEQVSPLHFMLDLASVDQELKNQHCMSEKIVERAFKESFLHIHDENFDDEYYFHELLNQVQARVDGPLRRFDIIIKK
eukprot:g430.t3